jgi:predicted MFS family arabinose efflux permease
MTTFFLAGAAGSAVGGWAYANGGWTLVSWIGIGLPLAALIYLATDSE